MLPERWKMEFYSKRIVVNVCDWSLRIYIEKDFDLVKKRIILEEKHEKYN